MNELRILVPWAASWNFISIFQWSVIFQFVYFTKFLPFLNKK